MTLKYQRINSAGSEGENADAGGTGVGDNVVVLVGVGDGVVVLAGVSVLVGVWVGELVGRVCIAFGFCGDKVWVWMMTTSVGKV